MDYVEIIRVRVAAKASRDTILRVTDTILGDGAPGLVDARVYRNARVESDLAVHLHYQLGGTKGPSDGLGDRLAAVLAEYGLVDRALWTRSTGDRDEGEAPR